MDERIWTISNILSFIRILLVLPIALFVQDAEPVHKMYAVGLILIAVLTDLFDGALARKLNQVTEFGKIMDPIADKISVVVVALILTQQGKLPLWFLLAAGSRDVAIFFGGMYIKKVKGIVPKSNLAGKWTVTVVAVLVVVAIVDVTTPDWLKSALLAVSTGMLILSFALYTKRFIEIVFQHDVTLLNS